MKFLCMAYEEEGKLNQLSKSEWHALRQETLDYVESMRRNGQLVITHALNSQSLMGRLRRLRSSSAVSFSSRRMICKKRSR